MSKPSLTDLAAKALARAHRAPGHRDGRERLVEQMEKARLAQQRAQRLRYGGFAALAAAAAVAVFFGLRRSPPPPQALVPPSAPAGESLVVRSGDVQVRHAEATSDANLRRGDALATRSETSVAAPRGTLLTLAAESELAVDDIGKTQIYSLPRRTVRAEVTKLGPNERFIVRTADVEVEVRGTSFLVEKRKAGSCHPDVETYVEVREGVVVVRHAGVEDRVGAGQSWPSRCEERPAPSTSASAPAAPTPSTAPASASDAANSRIT